jgi:NADH dehydrogenase
MAQNKTHPRVVIVGGGFGGLYAARGLVGRGLQVTLVDRRNHHLFQPLLYQVATAALNPSDIAAPIRSLLGHRGVRVLLAEATAVDLAGRRLVLADGELPYDYLVLSTGATHSYFGHDEWARHAPGLKTVEDALEIRRRVLLAYELAEREADPQRRAALTTFAIIGAGPTGVELAGALAEIARHTLAHEFTDIDPSQARIILLEGADRTLPVYPEPLSARAQRALQRLGVEVRTGAKVTAIDQDGLSIGQERIAAHTVLWAAGVAASPLARSLGVPLDRAGRVKVTPELTVPGHPEVFVIGDLAAVEQGGAMVPGVAPAAMQGGRHAARSILRSVRGEPLLPFHYRDKGMFAVIGRGAAVGVAAGRLKVSGFLAWLAWLFIHILYLVGFRNRVVVLVNWAYSYLTLRRGARLITYGLPAPGAPGAPSSPGPAATRPRDAAR